MIVVVTGMTGVDKKSYLQQVCKFAGRQGKEVQLCNIGDMMYAEAPDIPPGKILDISMKRLSSLRRSVFKDAIAKAASAENVIVNTHATFRWRHGLFPAVDFDQMRQLNADLYINVIDGVIAMHARLAEQHNVDHTLKDLIVWREEEILGTELVQKGVNERAGFYCIARGHGHETVEAFCRLVFEPRLKKAYLSFPMTHVSDLRDVRDKIDKFRQDMKRSFTCFDPGDLEESYLPDYARQAALEGKKCIELPAIDKMACIPLDQISQIERDINSQIYARDFMLIDQSDMIISLIPPMPDGRAAISSGVERELQHAHEAAKEVYVIWTADQRPSVFVTQTATKVFTDEASALAYFKQKGYISERDNR